MDINEFGALSFGMVVGYLTYRTLIRTVAKSTLDDLAAVVGVIGGGVITSLYGPETHRFGWYAVGLPVGMAVFFLAFWKMNGKEKLGEVMISPTLTQSGTPAAPSPHGPRL